MRHLLIQIVLIAGFTLPTFSWAINGGESDSEQRFREIDSQIQNVKLKLFDANRSTVKYIAKSHSDLAKRYQGGQLTQFQFDKVLSDAQNKRYLQAINRYHTGRDLGVIPSKYKTAVQVAAIYLDYGLYDHAKRLFEKLLGNEDSALASMARYQLARHDYNTHNWEEALARMETVKDGLPDELMNKKRIMQGVILQMQKRHKEAIAVLAKVPQYSKEYSYAQFNIAMSNLRQGWWSDAEDIIRKLLKRNSDDNPSDNSGDNSGDNFSDKLSDNLSDNNRLQQELADRLYIALGYAQIQRRFYREAHESLSQVSEGSVYAYKAKLGLGLIAAEQGKYNQALEIVTALSDSYAKLLVTEESHLVTPFLIESLQTPSVSIAYYEKAIAYYQNTVAEVAALKEELKKGKLDDEFVKISFDAEQQVKRKKLKPGKVNRYLFELLSTDIWLKTTQNLTDLLEITAFIDNAAKELKSAGHYKVKTYLKIKKEFSRLKKHSQKLLKKTKKLLRQMVAERLQQRNNYFTSYLHQSTFALARNIDKALGSNETVQVNGKTYSEKSVREAYGHYLSLAVKASVNRRTALKRLAELEVDYYEFLLAKESASGPVKANALAHLNKAIALFNKAYGDYPLHKKNDVLLYQLIDAYDKKGDREGAVTAMRALVDNYPESVFYTQIQFKLGEEYLVGNESIDAELAYSAALQRGNDGSVYYKRALYNRGWARLKQSLYEDALDDFLEVLAISDFGEHRQLSSAEKDSYEDILRAIGLCFTYQGGLTALKSYFTKHSSSPYKNAVYRKIGEMYEDHNRVSDAVSLYEDFVKTYPTSAHAPLFSLRVIEIWKGSVFKDKELLARKAFDESFVLDGKFWRKNDIKKFTNIRDALKNNMLSFTAYYHSRYQNRKQAEDLDLAKYWYERFFRYFDATAEAGKTHFLYAELLDQVDELTLALQHYDAAAKYRQNDKAVEAAYAKIVTVDKMAKYDSPDVSQDKWLLEKARQTVLFAKQNPSDRRAGDALMHVLERLFKRKLYKKTVEISNLMFSLPKATNLKRAKLIKANSLFELQEYNDAEQLYKQLLTEADAALIAENQIEDRLGSAIYKQGEFAQKSGDDNTALKHFLRVAEEVPLSTITAVAQFDAAALLIKTKQQEKAIKILEEFRETYVGHELQAKVTQQLAVLYMTTDNRDKAAAEFERITHDPTIDEKVKREALLQAADIYEQAGKLGQAIDMYTRYVHIFPNPFIEAMEARNKLVELFQAKKDLKQANYWRQQIIQTDSTGNTAKSERSRYLAAKSLLAITAPLIEKFDRIKLVSPLKKTLVKKKQAMNDVIDNLLKVNQYSIQETTTESTYKIAQLYYQFSKALLNSERPADLEGDALEQYELLLEEQAFPFEEKAISYHETNTQLTKQGVYDSWVEKSYSNLSKLLPLQYNKHEKTDTYVNEPLTIVMASN